ncbi:cyclic nucleotide-binding domain-containing protein [Streptomyces sp. H27-C3]|uniref:cyclic nucleotide-binding domain-containing protein n=1 Tax=Streptomyces sp. H27-C3 TaxID=3046305 RepID=UPI0024BA306F|nr:cyclic nucleotide-binding domain-containing protein [Streptomyces sp. H27-C3]MDJ0465548.1 cyclic nucleotide-binding domain-containing protein [Streptomyces sp. H27-C3]
MISATDILNVLPPGGRDRLLDLAGQTVFPAGTRIFEEGHRADRFWIIQTGSVHLDLHVPGRQAAVVESLGPGDLVGWSWLFPPYSWHLGAEAATEVRALEFDAMAVRALCAEDPELGQALVSRVAEVIGQRLRATRVRLLDLYGPYGSGNTHHLR